MRHSDDRTEIIVLPNGLRIAYRHGRGAAVEYCGVVVNVGSRDDSPDALGMAHFVEHTIFKGTRKRSSWHIINRMERVGGELNAYTTKEETVVYTAAPKGNLTRSVELISDLITNSRFPEGELSKEREVVIDEINSYLDTPSEAVFDDFEDIIFAGTPLGHNILGNAKSIEGIDSATCCEYLSKWYTSHNMTLFYYGPSSPDAVTRVVERFMCALPDNECLRQRLPVDFKAPKFQQVRNINTHQAHTVMGTVIGNMYSRDKFAVALITNILGGPGMNSLLNVALRERRGLVYSVEASSTLMSDCGLFTIYFGCDPEDTNRCIELVNTQLDTLANEGLSPTKLAQAKKQYLGQLAVASDNHENLAISTGRAVMYHNSVLTSEQTINNIMGIDNDQIMSVARNLNQLSTLTLN